MTSGRRPKGKLSSQLSAWHGIFGSRASIFSPSPKPQLPLPPGNRWLSALHMFTAALRRLLDASPDSPNTNYTQTYHARDRARARARARGLGQRRYTQRRQKQTRQWPASADTPQSAGLARARRVQTKRQRRDSHRGEAKVKRLDRGRGEAKKGATSAAPQLYT